MRGTEREELGEHSGRYRQLDKALKLRDDYDDAMAYMNLMYRERADVQCDDPAARASDLKEADGWVDRTMATKKAKAEKQPGATGIVMDQQQVTQHRCLARAPQRYREGLFICTDLSGNSLRPSDWRIQAQLHSGNDCLLTVGIIFAESVR